jgi:acetyl-CoA carboxylase biotin carboxyl carrier protein
MEKKTIDYDEIQKLIALMEEKKLGLFELEVEGFKIKMSKNTSAPAAAVVSDLRPAAAPSPASANPLAPSAGEPAAQDEAGLHYITSPMVGTFYRAPNPTSPPFIEEGEPVAKKQTLCIIEAMKLMNEIESDVDGVVREIFVENAKPVEFGQRLFSIRPAV